MLCFYLGYVHGCEWTNEFHLLNVKSKCILLYTKSTGYLIKSALCFSRQHGYIHGYEWTNEFHLLNVKSKCVLLHKICTVLLDSTATSMLASKSVLLHEMLFINLDSMATFMVANGIMNFIFLMECEVRAEHFFMSFSDDQGS